LTNANLGTMQAHAAGACSCNGARGKTSKQSLPSYKLWGGLTIFRQLYWKRKHKRGCCYYRENSLQRSTRTTFTYTGLCYIFSLALNLTVERQCENRSYLIIISLKTYNMRETSKAFEIFIWQNYVYVISHIQGFMTKLQEAYSLPDVSPSDVDQFGRTTAHLCIMVCSPREWSADSSLTISTVFWFPSWLLNKLERN